MAQCKTLFTIYSIYIYIEINNTDAYELTFCLDFELIDLFSFRNFVTEQLLSKNCHNILDVACGTG